MTSRKSAEFKYINRRRPKTLVLIPGWATDYRIFNRLNLRFNYLMPVLFSPSNFERCLFEALKGNNIRKVSLFGWSMGGFLAWEFASKYEDLVETIILVSIRKKYESKNISAIKKYLQKNKRAFLYKFYRQCFYKKDQMAWFRSCLLKDYCNGFGLDYLLEGLDYLEAAELKPPLPNRIENIKIIHGEKDIIAPIKEAIDVKNDLPGAEFISIKGAGHMPFLEDDFGLYV